MDWETVTLSDVAINIQTGPFGSQLHQSDYSHEGIPVVMPKDLTCGHISEVSIARVSQEHVDRLSRHKIEVGDIIYSRRGDVGRCAFSTEHEEGWLCGTGCLRVTIDSRKALPKFVFYQLQKSDTIGWIENHAVGSTMLNLNTTILGNIPIEIPPIPIQHRIASILSAYDDLIENNRRQIKLLEEAAQRLYKEWFVDFKFPGHENVRIVDGLPEGWYKCHAEDFFDISIGKTPPRTERKYFLKDDSGIPWLSISDMGESGTFILKTTESLTNDAIHDCNIKIVPEGTIFLSFKLTIGKVSIATSPMCTNEAIAHFRLSDKKFMEYTVLYLKQFEYDTLGNTSSISKAINSKIVKTMPFIIPTETIIKNFSSCTKAIIDDIYVNQKQIAIITEARDRLLPKLMSGEIEV